MSTNQMSSGQPSVINAIRVRMKITQNQGLILRNLPLAEGKKVAVIILENDADIDIKFSTRDRFPLRAKRLSLTTLLILLALVAENLLTGLTAGIP